MKTHILVVSYILYSLSEVLFADVIVEHDTQIA